LPDIAKERMKAEKKLFGKGFMRDALNENINAGNLTQRISWVDNAKALGIIAVFYGHIVEKIFRTYAIPEAGLQYKLIYSFHIPLFFLLSGYLVKETQHRKLFMFIKNKFMTRIVPFIFFNILMLLCYIIIENISNQRLYNVSQLLTRLLYLLAGRPTFNPIIWFLACLFSVEIINYLLYPVLRKSRIVLCMVMVLFYITGWGLSYKAAIINQYITIPDYWFIHEALVAYSFYLFGNLMAAYPIFHEKMNPYLNSLLIMLTAACVLATFNLNTVQFVPSYVVMVGNCEYGSFLLFPITAIAGSMCIILVSRIMPSLSFISFLGRNTLSLMGLSYIFVRFANIFFIDYSMEKSGNHNHFSIFMQCASITCITLLICVPLIIFLKRYLPFMIGYRKGKVNNYMVQK
jgi:acyltransferase